MGSVYSLNLSGGCERQYLNLDYIPSLLPLVLGLSLFAVFWERKISFLSMLSVRSIVTPVTDLGTTEFEFLLWYPPVTAYYPFRNMYPLRIRPAVISLKTEIKARDHKDINYFFY